MPTLGTNVVAESMTDEWADELADGKIKIMWRSHILVMRGNHIAQFVKFRPDGRTDGQTDLLIT